MRSYDERLGRLRQRARALRRRQTKTALLVSGGFGSALLVLLAVFTVQVSGAPSAITGSGFAGSSLLSENTGAYVLTAVLAFMAGAVVTILIRGRKEVGRKPKNESEQTMKEAEEDTSKKGGD